MTQASHSDPRWGDHVPWFLRHQNFQEKGNFALLFDRLSQRLERLLLYGEAQIANVSHFCSTLESESLRRFQFDPARAAAQQIRAYFDPARIKEEAGTRLYSDPEARRVLEIRKKLPLPLSPGAALSPLRARLTASNTKRLEEELREAEYVDQITKLERFQSHWKELVLERLEVLESLLRILPHNSNGLAQLIRDIKRFFVEAGVLLDIRGEPSSLVPIEEAALQRAVIDPLFARLEARYPERARELTKAYHDLLTGASLDSVFIEAFKTVEQLARDIAGDSSFMFDKAHLSKHFPHLHPAIHDTLIKLAGQRGAAGGHARSAPKPHEIRYLLFAICNCALLLLDYCASQGVPART